MIDSDEIPPPSPASPGGASPLVPDQALLPLAPRSHPATIGQRREAAPAGAKMSLEDFVSLLGRVELDDDDHSGEETSAEEAHQTRESRKFKRTESAAAKAARALAARELAEGQAGGAAPGEVSPDERTLPGHAAPRTADGAIIAGLTPRAEWSSKPRSNLLSNLAAQCVVVVLMGLCYALGRMTLPTRAHAPAGPVAPTAGGKEPAEGRGVPEPVMAELDEALAAQNAGDLRKAVRLLESLRSSGEHVNGLDYQLGWLAYRREDYPGALLALNRSIAAGEEVGASYDLRGMIVGEQHPGVAVDFEAATQANPFEATAFFHLGEALRRSGKPRQALLRLQQALDRAQTPAAQLLFGSKIRLTQIELGEEKDFAPALATALARPQPATEWLLTAAAQEMHAGNYGAAAAHLEQARQNSTPVALRTALQDYFFLGYADKPGLAGVFGQILGPAAAPSPAVAVKPARFPAVALPPPIVVPEENRGPK